MKEILSETIKMGNALFSQPIRRKILVFIEGNISAGKSTIISSLKELGYPVWEEAVNSLTKEYVDEEGRNILDLYYSSMKEHAFKLQMASLNTRWSIIKDALNHLNSPEIQNEDQPADIVFVERSLFTDTNTFAKHLRENNLINVLEWKIYQDTLKNKLEDVAPLFDNVEVIYFYLRAEPKECEDRKISRGRVEEAGVPLQYLQDIHSKHEEWLVPENSDIDRVIIDANKSVDQVLADINGAIHQILH